MKICEVCRCHINIAGPQDDASEEAIPAEISDNMCAPCEQAIAVAIPE